MALWGKKKADVGPPPPDFKAAGKGQEQQANLILARHAPGFTSAQEFFADIVSKRCDVVLLDFTRQAVAIRYQIDGLWHNLGQRDRESGDALLAVIKQLAALDKNERRARQEGTFRVTYDGRRADCKVVSEGVKTGERVMLHFGGGAKGLDTLDELGMREKMVEQVKEILNDKEGGLMIVAARPGEGLTTTWCGVLRAGDRYLRDFVGLEDKADANPEVENVEIKYFDSRAGESPDPLLKSILLRQPEAYVIPRMLSGKMVDTLARQVNEDHRLVITSVRAKEAMEAPLRIMALKPSVDKFAKALKAVLFQRLVRRLCEQCKQSYQPPPETLQKLGIPTGRPVKFFRQWQPPPPEEAVDQRGRPVEPEICSACNGLGYRGRIAVFELVRVDERIRQALVKQPKIEILRKLARAGNNRSLQEEGIGAVARGVTALAEIQRVLKT